MSSLVLKDRSVVPSSDVLESVLNGTYPFFEKWNGVLADFGIELVWRYYNDGKAWMGKLLCGKRNLGWLHVYDGYFSVTCYFMAKHWERIAADLSVPESLKEEFYKNRDTGTLLIPMTIKVRTGEAVEEIRSLLSLKKGMK